MQNLFFQAEDGIRDGHVTGVQTCALPILGFPVEVRALSRFQTPAEAQQVKDAVRDGSVDVVIGTHRLLTGEVSFKDLGLEIGRASCRGRVWVWMVDVCRHERRGTESR